MKTVINKLVSMLLGGAICFSSGAKAADIIIGVGNWPSVAATAEILKLVLEENLGVEVEIQNGTNPVIFEAMDKGDMHVHPEVWLPNQANLHDTYVKEKGSVSMNGNGVVAFTGLCVTKGTATRTGIAHINDLTNPDMASKFDTDGDGLGEMWIGASGWASTNIEKIRAKSYGFDSTMTLLEMDETLAMAKVDAAVAKKSNIVFMCYTPHHMFAKNELVVLKEPEHDPSKWNVSQPTDDPDWLENSSAPVAWSAPKLHIHYATSLKSTHPEVASVLSNIKLDTDAVSQMTYALVVKKQNADEFAKKWINANAGLVAAWLN